MRPVDLIIADAGPLISLAHADSLDMIKMFGRPVAIVDVAKAECLAKPGSPDYPALKQWFDRNHNAVQVVATPVMVLYSAERDKGGIPATTKDLGDFALVYALNHIHEIAKPGAVPLVLTEDKDLRATTVARGEVHVLSTRSWLKGLETAGLIPSAAAVVARMGRHGRNVAKLQADHPTITPEGKTDWIGAVLTSALTNDQLLARFAASDEWTKSVLNCILTNSAGEALHQDALALAALAPGAQELALAAIRVGRRLAAQPEQGDLEVMNVFSTAKTLSISRDDLKVVLDHGASDGLIRAMSEALGDGDGPELP